MDGGDRASAYKIGDWVFQPESHELLRGEQRVHLEHRNAALLAYLCARRGEVVSRDALLAHVWGGRHVSGNSLPTAIHAIRRALGDDAKNPTYLQTVAKAGYRLIGTQTPALAPAAALPNPARAMRRLLFNAAMIAAAFAVLGGVGLTLARAASTPHPITLVLTRLSNQTGDPRYDTTARASESVLVEALGHYGAYRVRRGGAAPNDIQLDTKLVLWSGLPDIVLEARDSHGVVLWSGFAFGPEPTLPQKINELVARFAANNARSASPNAGARPSTR